jgi:hypothetical protein
MKKIFLMVALAFSLKTFSQNELIRIMPDLGQNYIVLDKKNNSNVNSWRVEVVKRTYQSQDVYQDDVVEMMQLDENTNYAKILPEYQQRLSNAIFMVNIEGYNAIGEKIAEDRLREISKGKDIDFDELCPNCLPPQLIKHWSCNGRAYSWTIKHYQNFNPYSLEPSTADLVLDDGIHYYDPEKQRWIPFYFYIDRSTFIGLGITDVDDHINNLLIVGEINDGTFCDPTGSVLDHPVYGLMKKADGVYFLNNETLLDNPFWKSGLRANDFPFGASYTHNKSINWAIDQMNLHADGLKQPNPAYRPLECIQYPCALTGWTNPSPSDTSKPYDFIKWAQKILKCRGHDFTGDTCILGIINDLPNDVITIIINDLNKPDKPIIEIPVREYRLKRNQNFHSLNRYIKNNRKLSQGLYEVAFVLDGVYFPVIEELKFEESNTTPILLADILNANIYPVPIIGNEFNIKLNAEEMLNVVYTLHDANGTELHRQNINVPKNQEINRTIRPKNNIPNGIILHRFTFDDGSVKTIETIKN